MALVEGPLSTTSHDPVDFQTGSRRDSISSGNSPPSALSLPAYDAASAPPFESETPTVTGGPSAASTTVHRHVPLRPEDLLCHMSTQVWPSSNFSADTSEKLDNNADMDGLPMDRSIITALSIVLPDNGDAPQEGHGPPEIVLPAPRLQRSSHSCVAASMNSIARDNFSPPAVASTPPAALSHSSIVANGRSSSIGRRASTAVQSGRHKRAQSVDLSGGEPFAAVSLRKFEMSPGEGEATGRIYRWTPPRTPNFSPTSSSPGRLIESHYRVHTSNATLGGGSRRSIVTEGDINKDLDSLWQQDGADAAEEAAAAAAASGKDSDTASNPDGQIASKGTPTAFADGEISPDRGPSRGGLKGFDGSVVVEGDRGGDGQVSRRSQHQGGGFRAAVLAFADPRGAATQAHSASAVPRAGEPVKSNLKSDRLGIPRVPSPHRLPGDKAGGFSPGREFSTASQGINALLSSPSRFKHVSGPGDMPVPPNPATGPSGSHVGANLTRGASSVVAKTASVREGGPAKFSAASRSSAARGGAKDGWRSYGKEKGVGGMSFFAKSTPMKIGAVGPEQGVPFPVAPLEGPLKPAYDSDTDRKDDSSSDDDADDDVDIVGVDAEVSGRAGAPGKGPLRSNSELATKMASELAPGASPTTDFQKTRLFNRTLSAKTPASSQEGSGGGNGGERALGARRKTAMVKASAMWSSAIDRFKGKQQQEEGVAVLSTKERWRSGEKSGPGSSTPRK